MEEHQKPVLRPFYLAAKEAARSSKEREATSLDEEVELDRDLDAANRFVLGPGLLTTISVKN
ncbi:hypothetical protein MUK42_35656 [Musa troglodytarum]|uniref:Uncharacterized protein n=1 Tax=Musa troglodytarum TaxID=320322 RepID=A0A9E7KBQ2_9LILI|nr:hypothetical protein MUK42_35656 [Musa troglodytarum]